MTHFFLHSGKSVEFLMIYSGTLCPIVSWGKLRNQASHVKTLFDAFRKRIESKLCRAKSSEAWVAS